MRYLSVFSGIEAASVAWGQLGWEPVAFSEVDDFPSAVLAEHFPDVPNLGDITKADWSEYRGAVDLVAGGSPCQSFSIAGSRTGLDGASGLMWEYVRCVREVRPDWLVWENVPGALSSTHGEDFGCLLRSLDDLGYGLAWRVLDAQFFGVAQRRRRVFLVGHIGDKRAAEVLFEPESLRWDYPSSREEREALAGGATERFERAIAANQRGELRYDGGDGQTVGAIPASRSGKQVQAVVCMMGDHGKASVDVDMAGTLTAHDAKGGPSISDGFTVRRLIPIECERLQGFPDGWTDVAFRGKPAPDGRRYKALGNSMAVPVMRWIGERIEEVDSVRP